MSSWAERVHRRAADLGSVVTSCGHPGPSPAYPYRLEKVKFGVPLDEVFKNDNIPGPLLVLILKLNKESPNRRDVFRAPGHQGAMKKLIHFLQAGRLVNVDNYSVYTIASVLKKFLRKIPNGIFGRSGEDELFDIIELDNEAEQQARIYRLITSLPKYTQHLLVLLFGTFRVIASNAAHACTGMTSEALGVSVAPSFFQSCVSDGKTARMEDVLKFKVATKIMKHIIDKFAIHDLFGRPNYEYYARVTGRILKVQDEWICSFQYPPPPRGKLAQQKYALQHSLEAEKTWLQCQCERWGLMAQEESRSTPALLTSSSSALENSVLSLGVTPEHSFMESCARLSVSLEGHGLFALTSSPIPKHTDVDNESDDGGDHNVTDEEDFDYDDEADEQELAADHRDNIENKPKNNVVDGGVVQQRRYRRNKKTTTHQLYHYNRLKAKSNEVYSDNDCIIPPPISKQHNPQKASTVVAAGVARTCGRCNRGIRHSSSCSLTRSSKSTSGGGSNNSHIMTMDELRAVNRYAESTKSLSYLPQVHERQTARMRTRSEWFLGPDDVVGSMDIKTCSTCCMSRHRDDEFLGGGSSNNVEAASNELHLMFKMRQQKQQQQQPNYQQQYQHHLEHMDTDESGEHDPHSTLAFISPDSTIIGGQPAATATRAAVPGADCSGGSSSVATRMFLETNFSTTSGSYDAISTSVIKNNFNSTQTSTTTNNSSFISYNSTNNTNKCSEIVHCQIHHNRHNNNHYHHHHRCPSRTRSAYVETLQQNHFHYFSTESIHYCDEENTNAFDGIEFFNLTHEGTCLPREPDGPLADKDTTTIARFHSPQKIHLSQSAHNLAMLQCETDLDSTIESSCFPSGSAVPRHHNSKSILSTAARSSDALHGSEEVDYILTSRFRHSTPVSGRRRNRRQRFPSTSSYRSTSSRSRTATSGTSEHSGFVTVLFNVLDFLF